ncbi:MAG: DUF559 domain-containing protein [Synergistaceae bacterium]|nr:DUF559 domain-containing protein [Synergistaceae bacterium]
MKTLFSKGKPSAFYMFFNKNIKAICNGVRINGNPINSVSDCETLSAFVEINRLRAEIEPLWNELLGKNGVQEFSALGSDPENIAMRFVPDIQTFLDWHANTLTQFRDEIENCGLSFDLAFPMDRMATEQEQFSQLFYDIVHKLPGLLQTVCEWTEYNAEMAKKETLLSDCNAKQTSIMSAVSSAMLNTSLVCRDLRKAIFQLDVLNYETQYGQLCELYTKYVINRQRREILSKLRDIAPFWAEAIENRQGIHGSSSCPDNIADAWKWKQFAGIIDEITGRPFEDLQKQNASLSKKFREATAELAAYKAWYHLLRNTESDLSMRQALQGWKMTVRKIGKGTGKNAPLYRRQAMEQMAMCQRAVPAWIMPVSKAMDTLNPAVNKFDVIIVDEASQCDLSSIGILYMAKKIIIVGDDKQVSPLAVGVDVDRINALRDMYIKEVIPNWVLYEAKTSLYDIAQTTFQPLMLREHFRCLPEIIGYSNKLSYDYKIKPLRDSGTAKLLPQVVSYRVADGERDGRRKVNVKEAEAIVAIISACIEQPEYSGMTFGVISLLGDYQAQLIQTKILDRLSADVIQDRLILCGNASHFQGDERDIIILSLVDSNEGDGPLRLTGQGIDASTKQRYNVAASRAKEQLWVVHSLDFGKDLKSGDMRRDLLEYAANPSVFVQVAGAVEARAGSPFEESVGKSLIAAGYSITQQYEVGAYRIDMVVSCGKKKVALECDGEAWHSSEYQIRSDMERQAILERIGWQFIRIRGSEYYRDPDKTMQRVKNALLELGITPEHRSTEESHQSQSSALLDRVKVRVNQILDEWYEPDLSSIPSDVDDVVTIPEVLPVSGNILSSEQATVRKEIHGKSLPSRTDLSQPLAEVTKRPVKKQSTSDKTDVESKVLPTKTKPGQIVPAKHDTAQAKEPRRRINDGQLTLFTVPVISELERLGVAYIDNRATGSYLWVIDSPAQHSDIEQALKGSEMNYSFEKRGSLATKGKPAWRAN